MGIAHIGHAELRVKDLEASREFFTDGLGLFVSEETDQQVFLRAWQDWDHHTLVLTRAPESGLGHVAWRVEGPEDLPEFERRLKGLGVEVEWLEGSTGHGDSLRFRSPQAGVPLELYWEVQRFRNQDPAYESRLPSHPQRYTGRGVAPRRFDHTNFLVNDVRRSQEWFTDVLGIRHNYYVVGGDDTRLGSWMARTNLSHEIAFMRNRLQDGNRLHHVAYYLDSADHLLRGATLLADAGYRIEWGPGAHGTSGAIFLYAFEPSGHRVEVWTGGFLLFAPDWEPIRWDPENAALALELWGSPAPDTYFARGTPLTESPAGAAVT
jgi:catechol 2,3-dioxygenase